MVEDVLTRQKPELSRGAQYHKAGQRFKAIISRTIPDTYVGVIDARADKSCDASGTVFARNNEEDPTSGRYRRTGDKSRLLYSSDKAPLSRNTPEIIPRSLSTAIFFILFRHRRKRNDRLLDARDYHTPAVAALSIGTNHNND